MRAHCLALLALGLGVVSLGSCGEEPGYTCKGAFDVDSAPKCRPSPPLPVCGNDILEWDEECDDGNEVSGDGCEPDCTIVPVCGNALAEPGEDCDDGNEVSGDGCEPDCTFLPLEADATCFDSEGVVEPDEEGACTFYVLCPIPGGVTLPIKVRPLPIVVAEEGRVRARLEQTLLLTSAIRGSLPELAQVLLERGSVEYGLVAPSGLTTFSADATGLIGPLALPVEGEPAMPIDFERAEVEFDHDPTVEFSVDLLRAGLSVSILADELICEVVGDASVLYSP